MKKGLIITLSSIVFVSFLSLIGVGFSAWYFNTVSSEPTSSNVSVTSFIDFDYLELGSIDVPDEICFEDVTYTGRTVNSTGIFFLKKDSTSSLLDDYGESNTNDDSDVVYFTINISENYEGEELYYTSTTDKNFEMFLGIKMDSSLSKYIDLGDYNYDEANNKYGKKLTPTISSDYKTISSPYEHLLGEITYKNQDEIFYNYESFSTFYKAVSGKVFTFVITVKGA